jgi:peptide-methionine (S)-S-oxide reductase
VLVGYDPAVVSYDKLLDVFFELHDPTTLNRQGPDVGSQYRSAIFWYNNEQKIKADMVIDKLVKSGKYKNPIVTEIKPAGAFYPAEEYHQKYFQKQGVSCGIK